MEKLIQFNDQLNGAPVGVLAYFVSIALGYLIKSTRRIPNWIIPTVVVLLCTVMFTIGAPGAAPNIPLRVWIMRNVSIGIIIGFVAWMTHKLVLKKLEQKFGWFVDDGTKEYKKTDFPDDKPVTPPEKTP